MIYFDNAATTYPKPPQVLAAVGEALVKFGANPGRGSYDMSNATGRMVSATRDKLARFFNCPAPERLVFTSGATASLNIAIKGLLRPGGHVVFSGMEHNAVWRPLKQLEQNGVISLSMVPADSRGRISASAFASALRPETSLLVCLHASNVTGGIMPIAKIGALAKERGIPFLVDASQSAGVLQLDAAAAGIGLLAFSGHKSLYGPMGAGCLYVAPGLELAPLIAGGTGSSSHDWRQPQSYPDHLESGTPNVPGIAGLSAGLDFVLQNGPERIREKNCSNTAWFLRELAGIRRVTVYGPPPEEERVPVITLNIGETDPARAAAILREKHDIAVRAGYHCTPLAHRAVGTGGRGSVRFSLGFYTTREDIERALYAIEKMAG
ncbi:MAG: aminotransferase class V-fold PLP-dependent enzyme [Clostridiales bacterium]|nr:aminotransferase class V-fold PLP-dependent enzyme [Clostridiales bacterium]